MRPKETKRQNEMKTRPNRVSLPAIFCEQMNNKKKLCLISGAASAPNRSLCIRADRIRAANAEPFALRIYLLIRYFQIAFNLMLRIGRRMEECVCGTQPTIKSNDAAKGPHGRAPNGQGEGHDGECRIGEVWWNSPLKT